MRAPATCDPAHQRTNAHSHSRHAPPTSFPSHQDFYDEPAKADTRGAEETTNSGANAGNDAGDRSEESDSERGEILSSVNGNEYIPGASRRSREQFHDDLLPAHPSFDFWSLGVSMYRSLTHKQLLEADDRDNIRGL